MPNHPWDLRKSLYDSTLAPSASRIWDSNQPVYTSYASHPTTSTSANPRSSPSLRLPRSFPLPANEYVYIAPPDPTAPRGSFGNPFQFGDVHPEEREAEMKYARKVSTKKHAHKEPLPSSSSATSSLTDPPSPPRPQPSIHRVHFSESTIDRASGNPLPSSPYPWSLRFAESSRDASANPLRDGEIAESRVVPLATTWRASPSLRREVPPPTALETLTSPLREISASRVRRASTSRIHRVPPSTARKAVTSTREAPLPTTRRSSTSKSHEVPLPTTRRASFSAREVPPLTTGRVSAATTSEVPLPAIRRIPTPISRQVPLSPIRKADASRLYACIVCTITPAIVVESSFALCKSCLDKAKDAEAEKAKAIRQERDLRRAWGKEEVGEDRGMFGFCSVS